MANDNELALLRKVLERAREVADDEGYCDQADVIIGIIESEFMASDDALAASKEYMGQFSLDDVSDWGTDRIMREVRRAFTAGWDKRGEPIRQPSHVLTAKPYA